MGNNFISKHITRSYERTLLVLYYIKAILVTHKLRGFRIAARFPEIGYIFYSGLLGSLFQLV